MPNLVASALPLTVPVPTLAVPVPTLAAPVPLLGAVPAQDYTLTSHTVLRLGQQRRESATQLRVRKTWLLALPDGGARWEMRTLARAQTPPQGAEQLAAELAPVLETLVVETDPTGALTRVLNLAQLQAHWARLLPGLRAGSRPGPPLPPVLLTQLGQVLTDEPALVELLRAAPTYALLLPTLYGRAYVANGPGQPGTAVLPGWLGSFDLPLHTLTRLVPPTASAGAGPGLLGSMDLALTGEVNPDRYPAEAAGQLLRQLLDQPRLDTQVVALHDEYYGLGPRYALREARRHTRADVPGLLSQQLTVLLQAVEPLPDSNLTSPTPPAPTP